MAKKRRVNHYKYGNLPDRRPGGPTGNPQKQKAGGLNKRYAAPGNYPGTGRRQRKSMPGKYYHPVRPPHIYRSRKVYVSDFDREPLEEEYYEQEVYLPEINISSQDYDEGEDWQEYAEEDWQESEQEYTEEADWQESEQQPEEEDWQEDEPPQKRGGKKVLAVMAICLVLLLAIGGYVYYRLPQRCVKTAIFIEAGDACPAVADFLNWECGQAYIVSGISDDMDFRHVQNYEVVIHLYSQNVTTILYVVDTVPPRVQTQNKTIMLGEPFSLEDFVESVSDITDYEVSYQEEPDVESGGEYTIALEVVDEGGNVTHAHALLEVLQDVTPPEISGVEEITILVGESVSYKRNVTVTDDYDDAVRLEVDNSEVDVDKPGDYPVIYRATDKAGNMTEVATVLHVKAPVVEKPAVGVGGEVVTEETVNAAADQLLASITDSSMSQYEIIKAIYDWCHAKIAYVNGASKDNWVQGAYDGLVKKKGDCYTYAMTAKCLLNRAGITNMDIERVRVGNGMHFWNLVDIGEGWHHFDTCRRADGSTFFYLTDAELMAYSETHTGKEYPNGTHYYDRTLYPEIP